MKNLFESKRFDLWAVSFLVAAVLIVYSNTFNAAFHFDDTPQIIENYKLRDLKNLGNIIMGPRGVTMATFALNYAAGGTDVTGYHVVNTVIHIINGILVYFLLFHTLGALGRDQAWSRKIAVYSALLFAVHPVQTQSVTYIVQRMESLAALFFLLALLIFQRAVKAEGGRNRVLLYAAVVVMYLLSFKSKEVAITLPAVIFLYDLYFVGKGSARALAGRWPFYLVLVLLLGYLTVSTVVPLGGFGDLSDESSGIAAVTAAPAHEAPSAGFGVKSISPKEYLYTQFNVILYYMTLMVVPANQNLDYDFPLSRTLFETPAVNEGTVLNFPIPPPAFSLAVHIAIIGLALWCLAMYRKKRAGPTALVVSFFILWFYILLMPTSSFIPILDVIFEHRLYLPSVGFIVIFAVGFDRFFSWVEEKRGAPGDT